MIKGNAGEQKIVEARKALECMRQLTPQRVRTVRTRLKTAEAQAAKSYLIGIRHLSELNTQLTVALGKKSRSVKESAQKDKQVSDIRRRIRELESNLSLIESRRLEINALATKFEIRL